MLYYDYCLKPGSGAPLAFTDSGRRSAGGAADVEQELFDE